MQKTILVLIIMAVLIVIIWGVYFFMTNFNQNTVSPTNQNTNSNTANSNEFEIQGIKVEILEQGSGVAAKNDDNVTVNYVGTLADGTKFDSSIDRNAPFTFMLGKSRVIKGWDLGVVGMKVGEKRKLIIPPELAYGDEGFLIIPKKATLTFEVELLKIN